MCVKIAYPTESAAIRAALGINHRLGCELLRGVHLCPACRMWHTTSRRIHGYRRTVRPLPSDARHT
jgi:hypothetical protein